MCHFTHLAKNQEMKSISNPRWPNEFYTFWQNLSTDDFIRKKISVPPGGIRPLLGLTPHKKMGNSYATKATASPKRQLSHQGKSPHGKTI